MPPRSSRRAEICDAALDLAAEGGNHALTHQAIDKRLGIAQGSTSYYFRTRQALVTAVTAHLAAVTRDAFTAAQSGDVTAAATVDGAAAFIGRWIDSLLGTRRRDVVARYALLPDAAQNDELRAALARCLFGPEAAIALMESLGARDPARAGRDLLSLLEGLLFDRIYGAGAGIAPGTAESLDDLRRPVALWLETLQRAG
jgi:AcrR family transcriptional regulator